MSVVALPRPYYADEWVRLYQGDCRDIVPALTEEIDLVLTDPPYGIGWDTDGRSRGGRYFPPIIGDDAPFDPAWLLSRFPRLVLFGANHYADRLPASPSWVVWDKRVGMASNDQADCELAWTNLGGPARMFRQLWNGGGGRRKDNPTARRGEPVSFHPTQKPLGLMRWLIERHSRPGDLILDPYAGSGTTLRAAKDLGRRAIGIEIEPLYCETAARRLAQEVLPFEEEAEASIRAEGTA